MTEEKNDSVQQSLTVEGAADDQVGGRTTKRPSRRRTKKSSPVRSPDAQGADFERRVGRVEFAEGALVRLRVPVRVAAEPGREVLTDIDVLSIDVDLRLRLRRSAIECKSAIGESGEIDRLLWLAGFRQYLGVDRAALVRLASATQRGRGVAQQLGIQLLDGPTLASRERANAWLPEHFAHVAGNECISAERRADTQLKAFPDIPSSLVGFLRHQAWISSPFEILTGLVALDAAIKSMAVVPETAGTNLAGHALCCLVLAILEHGNERETLSPELLRKRIESSLTTGSPDDDHVLEILGRADAFLEHQVDRVHDMYVAEGAQRQLFEIPSMRDQVAQPPDWVEAYLDVVDRFRGNTPIARDLLQTVELACFEALVGGEAWKASAFDHLFTPEHRNLLMVAIRLLEKVVGPELCARLAPLSSLPFDRVAPSLPDRGQPLSPAPSPVNAEALAKEPDVDTQPERAAQRSDPNEAESG